MRGLGVFEVSYQLSNFTTTELVAPINRAVLPGLSKVAGDAAALRDNYLKVIGMIALLALPTGVGIAVVAEPLVFVVLGPDWAEAAPIIAILGIVGAIGSIETNTGTTCVAAGRPDLVAKLYSFYVTVLLILVYFFTSKWGLIGTAWAGLVATCINVPVYYAVLLRLLGLRFQTFVGALWRPVMASIVMYVGVRFFLGAQPALTGSVDALPVLLKATAIGATVYTAVVVMIWLLTGRPAGSEQHILELLHRQPRTRIGGQRS
jgi:O-antigen/teichoic acid export membrane protein